MLDLIPDAAMLVDTKRKRILLANHKCAELSAFTRVELAGKPIGDIIPDFPELPDDSIARGESTTADAVILTRQGNKIEAQVELIPIDEHIQKAVLQIRPRSHLTQQQTNIEIEKNRWEAIRVLVLASEQTSADAAVDQIIQAARLLTGADIVGVYLIDPADDRSLTAKYLTEDSKLPANLSVDGISHLQVPLLWKPGERSVSPLHSKAISEHLKYMASVPIDQSEPLKGILVAGDHTSEPPQNVLAVLNLIASTLALHLLPNLEKSLSQSHSDQVHEGSVHSNYKRIFDAMDEGLILLDETMQILSINMAAETILGVRAVEMIGKKAEDLLISSPPVSEGLMEVLDGAPAWNLEIVNLRHRNGQVVPASMRVLSLGAEEGQGEMAVILTDLSDEEQYRARAQQLEQQAFLGEVSAIFAHEVRNPINNISTGLELMSMELAENENVQDFIDRIQDDFERLTDLMKSVLSFSGRREYQIRRIDLVPLVDKILDRWRVRSRQNNITFHLSPPKESALINGDQRAIEQVLTNLISNSVKAMEENGGDLTVKFGISLDESGTEMVEILISDTGPGIPREVIEHIFEPFYTTKEDGTGLGLAISKRIVEAHKGKISAQSFPGVTIFKVEIPIIIHTQEESHEQEGSLHEHDDTDRRRREERQE